MSDIFQFRSQMPASAEKVYSFHAEADALERLTPPWEKARVTGRPGKMEQLGSRTTLRVSFGPFSQDWIAEHTACEPGKMFRDVMVAGPFRRWEHTHEFQAVSEEESWLEDRVEYELPLGWLGELIGGAYTRRRLERMFKWRHKTTREILRARNREGRV